MAHRTCSILECARPHYGHGMCMMHWHRWRRHGDPEHGRQTQPLICTVQECGKPTVTRGWCAGHYAKWKRHGSPTGGRPPAPPYYLPDENGCWIWQRELDTKGYGMYRIPRQWKKVMRAHRWVYEQHRGPIPAGLELDHLCRVPACVNPAHLEPVTHAENVRRGALVRTHCKRGHERIPENTIYRKDGTRTCRPCFQLANRRYYQRKYGKEEAA